MNTQEVAVAIGTEAKVLRRFLRDPSSTFEAVGSGSRYEFDEADVPVLKRKFTRWVEVQKKSVPSTRAAHHTAPTMKSRDSVSDRDREVWAEEGDVYVPDVRDPKVRTMVRAIAETRAAALDRMLLEAGLHISQHRS